MSDTVALQFSGGRDSLACLYLMRDRLDEVTVYWLDSGDNFPETHELVAQLKEWVPHFITVQGDSPGVREDYGWPVDTVPCSADSIGMMIDSPPAQMQNRYDCCYRSIMLPLHERMIRDGVTVVIRGQRQSDTQQSPVRHGEVVDGMTVVYPIEDWSDANVMNFLHEQDAPIPRYYLEGLHSAPDCMGCTGWLEERRGPYLKRFHPEAYATYRQRLEIIATELTPHIDALMEELT